MEKRPQLAVRAVICNDKNEILLLKRDNTDYCPGCWNLPGGKVDYNETAEVALIHEIKEETSMDVRKARFLFYLDNLPDEESDLHFVTLIFHAEVDGTLKINGESSDYSWVSQEKLSDYRIAFSNDKVMRRYWKMVEN